MFELLISEFMLRGFCADELECAADGFIEIYNDSEHSFAESGWRLEYRNAQTSGEIGEFGKTQAVLTELSAIAPYSYAVYPVEIGSASQGYLQLVTPEGEIVDFLGYGKTAALHAPGGVPAPAPTSGKSAGRCEILPATNPAQLAASFATQAAPSPGVACFASGEPDSGKTDDTTETPNSCSVAGLSFSEFFTYTDSEQFVELFNSNSHAVPLAGCQLSIKYGAKFQTYTFQHEIIEPGSYLAFYLADLNLKIAKDPAGGDGFQLIGASKLSAPPLKGQKSGKSWALLGESWQATLDVTPNNANALQLCPSDKIFNPDSGKCTNPPKETLPKECEDGYERNPETNRCRKIRQNIGESVGYGLPDTGGEPTRQFLALPALITAGVMALGFAIWHFREKLLALLKRFPTLYQGIGGLAEKIRAKLPGGKKNSGGE